MLFGILMTVPFSPMIGVYPRDDKIENYLQTSTKWFTDGWRKYKQTRYGWATDSITQKEFIRYSNFQNAKPILAVLKAACRLSIFGNHVYQN